MECTNSSAKGRQPFLSTTSQIRFCTRREAVVGSHDAWRRNICMCQLLRPGSFCALFHVSLPSPHPPEEPRRALACPCMPLSSHASPRHTQESITDPRSGQPQPSLRGPPRHPSGVFAGRFPEQPGDGDKQVANSPGTPAGEQRRTQGACVHQIGLVYSSVAD
ncbi:hypothetical protein PHLGIDRAFT_440827 [Phlebiopsis gigantea 11061_1 CR5-6]|uniref:Uncharacterized protein n=1 Tax=Phlebiopsis gigantea (strain 11061_1 CR5-6) TaxID=745531 RepID=A0A0C3SFB5_PHLG1|nr:hypothetical protein PHLGIDRAFT_440827 [Phlebiopsis gigantea 11061_1 CR5-6]